MKLKIKGTRTSHRLVLSGLGKHYKRIPPFFEIEIDTKKIKSREKEK